MEHFRGQNSAYVIGDSAAPADCARPAEWSRHHPAAGRRAISLVAILVSLVIVVLATIAVASTIVAVRATEARRRAVDDSQKAAEAVAQSVVAIVTHEDLKAFKMQALRNKLLEPALNYYQNYVDVHANDPVLSPKVAEAYFRIAGIKAKLGSMESVAALNKGVVYLDKLHKAKHDPETYPSLEECAMKVTPPNEWLLLRNASFTDLPKHAGRLVFAISGAIMTFEDLHKAYPQAVRPREELATVLKYSAMMQARQRRRKESLSQWSEARDVLETLVRDQPANAGYQGRLAEALAAIAPLQQQTDKPDAAIKSSERVVQIREQLLAAKPDDKVRATELETAKKELEKLRAAAPAAKVAASPELQEDPKPDGAQAADDEKSPVADDDKAVTKTTPEDSAAAPAPPESEPAPAAPRADEKPAAEAEAAEAPPGEESPRDEATATP